MNKGIGLSIIVSGGGKSIRFCASQVYSVAERVLCVSLEWPCCDLRAPQHGAHVACVEAGLRQTGLKRVCFMGSGFTGGACIHRQKSNSHARDA